MKFLGPNALIEYVQSHGITVLSSTETTITAEAVYSVNGVAVITPETFEATPQAVRNWLGY